MTAFRQMIDDLYADANLAVAGRYYPADGAPPFDIRVMKAEADTAVEGFAARAVVAGLRLKVRQSEVPAPKSGDTISRIETVGGPELLYDIQGRPEADSERLEWTLAVTERAA
jgi:hypothetical protein